LGSSGVHGSGEAIKGCECIECIGGLCFVGFNAGVVAVVDGLLCFVKIECTDGAIKEIGSFEI
jgi:hypothetical protein